MKMNTLELVTACFFLPVSLLAQQSGGGRSGGQGASNNNNGAMNIPSGPVGTTFPTRPLFLSGKVALSDGSSPGEPVKIERVCSGGLKLLGYTDSKGRFGFQLGQTQELQEADDTTSRAPSFQQGLGQENDSRINPMWGCDLRASLAGFRSETISLSTRHYLDNPDVGTIVLRRLANVDGLTVSATTALAPKDARKAFDKGMEAAGKKNFEQAQASLNKAVEIYPKYAAAWAELGKVYEARDQVEDARKAYGQAIAADAKYLPPYDRLSMIAFRQAKWDEVAENTNKLLRLDPFEYPDAYFMNGVANLQLQHLDEAEKSAREAIRLDKDKKNPRSQYLLGIVLAQKQQFQESAEQLRAYLAADPGTKDAETVRQQLAQIEAAAKPADSPAPSQSAQPNSTQANPTQP